MTEDKLLDYAGVAKRTGLAPSTLRRYRSIGLLPEPDELPVPDRPRWRESTIDEWMQNRPGRGAPGRPRGKR
jgi:predicted DNA-binding transcriptional regulator AlpA